MLLIFVQCCQTQRNSSESVVWCSTGEGGFSPLECRIASGTVRRQREVATSVDQLFSLFPSVGFGAEMWVEAGAAVFERRGREASCSKHSQPCTTSTFANIARAHASEENEWSSAQSGVCIPLCAFHARD